MLLTKATARHLLKCIYFKLKSPLKSQNTVFYFHGDLININMHKYLKEWCKLDGAWLLSVFLRDRTRGSRHKLKQGGFLPSENKKTLFTVIVTAVAQVSQRSPLECPTSEIFLIFLSRKDPESPAEAGGLDQYDLQWFLSAPTIL